MLQGSGAQKAAECSDITYHRLCGHLLLQVIAGIGRQVFFGIVGK